MRIPLQLKNHMPRLNETITQGHNKNFTNYFSQAENVEDLLNELGWYEYGNYLADKMASIISAFTENFSESMTAYFDESISLDVLANFFINYIHDNNIIIEESLLLPCVAEYERETTQLVKQAVKVKSYQKQIKILGFGIREGGFEKQIKDFLIQNNKITSADIYGFDPNIVPSFPIINLSKKILYSNECPSFDLIIIRWALHHVEEKERWDDLVACLNKANENAKIIFIEEGRFNLEAKLTFEDLVYDFLLCVADIVINFALNNNWMENIALKKEARFFIKYLTPTDVLNIEQKLECNFKKKITIFPEFSLPQTIFEYDVLASKSSNVTRKNSYSLEIEN